MSMYFYEIWKKKLEREISTNVVPKNSAYTWVVWWFKSLREPLSHDREGRNKLTKHELNAKHFVVVWLQYTYMYELSPTLYRFKEKLVFNNRK